MRHDPTNASCPRNADPRNRTCGCIYPVVRTYLALIAKATRYRDAGNEKKADEYYERATHQGYAMNAAAWRQVDALRRANKS